ncbi:MAG TPA: D-alanyl-D-alanine carboxypeptidase/D-alanyl-D-alanine-endopeptidase, partial [Thiothrix sp.]|nr:D-alanyl-D-alanine carboxypeptidase/D-alanyl-D-alanine-endopeptidase [Thiothrix sp.]
EKKHNPALLPQPIQRLLKRYKINPDNLSVYVKEIYATEPLISHHIDRPRNPASTMKLVTTYAALRALGPAYQWQTEAWRRGTIRDGVLDGDLILKGYGDPFLVHERYWKFIHDLKSKGLHTINGDIVIDNSYFDVPPIDPAAFDNAPHRIYNALPSALMFNFQATRFLFQTKTLHAKLSTEANKQQKLKTVVDLTAFPHIPDLQLTNRLRLSKGACRKAHYRPTFKRLADKHLQVSGSYSTRCGQQFILRQISPPEEHAFNAFVDFWRDLGGTFKGRLQLGVVDRKTDRLFHQYASPSLGEQIRLINKWSNNVMTRQLLLSLGANYYDAPATLEKGRSAILEVLDEIAVPNVEDIVIDNGSGLSRKARISAAQLGHLLDRAFRDAYMPEFLASLAIGGIDGTMYRRAKKNGMRGRSHLKTGTLRDVTAIAGYMLSRQGRYFIVVMQQNGNKVSKGRGVAVQNALLRWLFEQ